MDSLVISNIAVVCSILGLSRVRRLVDVVPLIRSFVVDVLLSIGVILDMAQGFGVVAKVSVPL